MAPRKGSSTSKGSKFADEAPWRALSGEKPIPRISQGVLSVRQGSNFSYALSIMKHPDPIGKGLASEAFVEAAGPECIIPGLSRPIRLLGLQDGACICLLGEPQVSNSPLICSTELEHLITKEDKHFQVWPLSVPNLNLKALEPLGRELQTFSKLLDRAFDLMQAPFGER